MKMAAEDIFFFLIARSRTLPNRKLKTERKKKHTEIITKEKHTLQVTMKPVDFDQNPELSL